MVKCLVEELGADVNQQANANGNMPWCRTAYCVFSLWRSMCSTGSVQMSNKQIENRKGVTPLFVAAQKGHLAMVRLLRMVKELGADINELTKQQKMAATFGKHADIVRWLVKAGADTQACATFRGTEVTAATVSKHFGASVEQTAYLEAKTHCSYSGCSGAGLLKCTGCKQARYCGEACQLAHWKAHKADCRLRASDGHLFCRNMCADRLR
jgi:hypothetical protein